MMPRITWDGGGRIRRISAYALSVLARMCAPDACIRFERDAGASGGSFNLYSGQSNQAPELRVTQRNVELLVGPRLLARVPGATPVYTITDKGRALIRLHAQDNCAKQGRDCMTCTLAQRSLCDE